MSDPPAMPPRQDTPQISEPNKLLGYFEDPLFLTSLGILAGIMGILISTPMLILCGILFLLAFYRKGVVKNKPLRVQLAAYIGFCVVVALLLCGVNILIKQNSPHFPTAREIASEIQQMFQRDPLPPQEKSTVKQKPTPQSPAKESPPGAPTITPLPLPRGPRLGIGPDAYKDLDDTQVGQWAVEEADKIAGMAEDCINKSIAAMKEKRSGNAEKWFFSNDFKKCCAQDVRDLRTEILRRLGPPGKDPKEESAWEILFPIYNLPGRPDDINPMAVKEYAKHLRILGLKLKRRSVPRAAPRELRFTEQQISPEKPELPYKILITVHTEKEITAGYIVVQWSGNWGIIHGHDLEDGTSLFSTDIMDNDPLSKFLEANRDPLPYSIQIGKMPFSPNKPMHVLASNNKPFHAARVILFDQ